MRAEDRSASTRTRRTAGNREPERVRVIDLAPLVPFAGGYVNPGSRATATSAVIGGHDKRNAFRGPGNWEVTLGVSKRIRFGSTYAVQFRVEAFNLLNHPNMYREGCQRGHQQLHHDHRVQGRQSPHPVGVKFEF